MLRWSVAIIVILDIKITSHENTKTPLPYLFCA
jgi:hypothetical protein